MVSMADANSLLPQVIKYLQRRLNVVKVPGGSSGYTTTWRKPGKRNSRERVRLNWRAVG